MTHQARIGCVHTLFILWCILHPCLPACCVWIWRVMRVWLGWIWLTFWNLNWQWERIQQSYDLLISQFVQVFWNWNSICSKLTCLKKPGLLLTKLNYKSLRLSWFHQTRVFRQDTWIYQITSLIVSWWLLVLFLCIIFIPQNMSIRYFRVTQRS